MKHLSVKIPDEDYDALADEAKGEGVPVSEVVRRRFGSVPKAVRAYVYERDAGICQICQKPIGDERWQIDHVIARSMGGGDEPTNLQLAHRACNVRKGGKNRAAPGARKGPHPAVNIVNVELVDSAWEALRDRAAANARSIRAEARVVITEAMLAESVARPVALDATQPPGAERGTPPPVPQSARRRAAATPRKARTHACDHRVPAGSYCKDCDR